MRIPRSFQLHDACGLVHKYWKCHNSSFLLSSKAMKRAYFQTTKAALEHKSVKGKVQIQAICLMNNHAHALIKYSEGSQNLSQFMRIAHSNFGRLFNKTHKRSGKVANERPKTPLVEMSQEDGLSPEMRVHFYIEANPLRAGLVNTQDDLLKLKFNSYRFYANGEVDGFDEMISIPQWYSELGLTNIERQKKYRILFSEYLKIFGFKDKNKVCEKKSKKIRRFLWDKESAFCFNLFVGSTAWQSERIRNVKNILSLRLIV